MSTPTLEELKTKFVKYDDHRRNDPDWISRGELQRERYLRTPCPAPATRKKLKSAMPDNKDLTAQVLYIRTGRKPGYRGRFAKWLRAQEEESKHKAELREIAKGKTKAQETKAQATASPSFGARVKQTLRSVFRKSNRGS